MYSISYTHFGFLFGPLFDFLGNNIAFLRIASILITFFCGALLTYETLRKIFSLENSIKTVSLAFSLAVPVLLLHASFFILTLSYNTSAYIGVILSLVVTLQFMDKNEKNRTMLSVALAACGVLLALSKPTTALIMGPTIIAFLFLFGQFKNPTFCYYNHCSIYIFLFIRIVNRWIVIAIHKACETWFRSDSSS